MEIGTVFLEALAIKDEVPEIEEIHLNSRNSIERTFNRILAEYG